MILADGAAYTNISEEIDGIPSEVCISFDANTGETRWKANLDLWRVDNGGGNAGTRDNKGGDGPRTTPSYSCLLYTSPSPRDATLSRMPSSA